MPTLVIRHDAALAEEIRPGVDDLEILTPADAEEVLAIDETADVFVAANSTWDDRFLEVLAEDAWVQTTSKGVDNFPLDRFEERGIAFTNAAGNHGVVVAEHAFALALSISRGVPTMVEHQRQNRWDRSLDITDWSGKTLTVVGLGEVGEGVARRGRAFNMETIGIKRDHEGYDGCVAAENLRRPDELREILPETDLLVLSVPLTDETEHLVDATLLERLPETGVLINVSRGGVVDEQALIDALQTGTIAAAGLDVYETEPLPADSPLWDMENVVVSPHVGGRSDRFAARFGELFLENYGRWRRGEELKNRLV